MSLASASRVAGAVLGLMLGVACAAAPPRPRVLGEIDGVRTSPASLDAEQIAPQAYAHAEELRRRAEAAQANDPALAQILGEQALAAYERAVIQARLTRAEQRKSAAAVRIGQSQSELKALEAQAQEVRAATEDLELRARVLSDAVPPGPNAPAGPERERARLEAARALTLQARLLCAAARLLEPARASLPPLLSELETLSGRLGQKNAPVPIDDATRLRSSCLNELTQTRRPKTLSEPTRGSADTLLSELSNGGYLPSRDDRGVVVTLREAFDTGATVTGNTQTKLSALGRVAGAHPEFPILVVLHESRVGAADPRRLDALVSALKQAGATRIAAEFAGDAAPLVDPARAGAKERNTRVEVVFVGPSSS